MRGSKLMFAAMLALLVNACSAMHTREWRDCAVDGGLLHGALGGLAGSPDVDRAQSGSNDGRAAGAGLALGPMVSTVVGHLFCNEAKEAPPPPVAQAPPPPSSETVEVHGPRPDLDRATLNLEGNGLWLRLSEVLPLLDEVDDSVSSRKDGDE
jgi:hypothetical protein